MDKFNINIKILPKNPTLEDIEECFPKNFWTAANNIFNDTELEDFKNLFNKYKNGYAMDPDFDDEGFDQPHYVRFESYQKRLFQTLGVAEA